MNQKDSLVSKIMGTLFALVFAVAFSYFGYVGGMSPLFRQVQAWQKANTWQVVDARVLQVDLDSFTGESTTYQTRATFEYQWLGKTYRSQQVALVDSGSDNIGDFHHQNYQKLKQAYDQEQTVHLWVDPKHPADAVYSKEIRWTKIVFLLPFAILFPLIGIGAWWLIFRIWVPKSEKLPQHFIVQMQAMGFGSNSHQVILPALESIAAWLGMSLFWNLISWPIAILVFAGSSTHLFAKIIAIIFPAIGGVMIVSLMRKWRTRRYWGQTFLIAPKTLRLDEISAKCRLVFTPGLVPASLIGASHHEQSMLNLHLQSVCDNRRGDTASTHTVYETELAHEQMMRGLAYFDFTLPELSPEVIANCEIHPELHYRWQLAVSSGQSSLLFPINIMPPVFPTVSPTPTTQLEPQVAKERTAPREINSLLDVLAFLIDIMLTRQRLIKVLLGIPFFGFVAWTLVTDFVLPVYQDWRHEQANPREVKQVTFTRIPFELNSLSGNGFSVLAKAQGYLEVSEKEMRIFPQELVLQSADDCAELCPKIEKVIFELTQEGADSFAVMATSNPIFVGEKLVGSQPLKVSLDKNQEQIWLQYQSRADLEKWRLTLSIHGKQEGSQASWYVHTNPFKGP